MRKTIMTAILAALVGASSIPMSYAQGAGGAGGAAGGAGTGTPSTGTTGEAPSTGSSTGTVGSGSTTGMGNTDMSNGAGSIQGGRNSTLNPSGNPALNPPPGAVVPGAGPRPR
jgi:hypothetical protein